MPRIAATIGVIALIVFSIGFNISQYPIVWENSDASSHLLPSAESSQSKTASQSSELPPADNPARHGASRQYAAQRPIDKPSYLEEPVPYEAVPYEPNEPVPDSYEAGSGEPSSYAHYTPPEAPSYLSVEPAKTLDGQDEEDDVASSPQIAETSAKYAADAESSTTSDGLPARRMVPVVITKPTPSTAETDQQPRRLPPIDQVHEIPADHQAVQLPMTPIPIYPATGF